MIPCGGTDYCVNGNMVVSSNYPAIHTPEFVVGASSVSLGVGDNLPFSFVDWRAPREDVEDGVTFRITRLSNNAYVTVTCGLFTCVDGTELVRGSHH